MSLAVNESTDGRTGVIIMDADRRIRLLTHVAEDLLGWRDEQVSGLACSLVFDCRDEHDRSLCEGCGLALALEQHEISSPASMRMADPFGARRDTSTTFWYLPPAGPYREPRAMAVVSCLPSRG
jgi:PAS domain-containing protein